MKSINKKLTVLCMVCIATLFVACTEEAKYIAANDPSNAQVYFSNPISQVELPDSESTFNIELRRIDTSEALTVNITSTTESPEIFTFPTSTSFASGEASTVIAVNYVRDLLDYDEFRTITLTITDENLTTPYGISKYEFKAGVPAPWTSLGEAQFTENFAFGFTYEVELQQHSLDPTRYRLVDPYTEGLDKIDGNTGTQSPYWEFQILPVGSTYKGVQTTVEGLVVYNDISTGMYEESFSDYVHALHPSRMTNMATENFWLYNAVTQWSTDGKPEVVQMAPYYYLFDAGAGANNTQANDIVIIVFPGAVRGDFSVDISYRGRYTDIYDEDYAIANINLGEDISYAKVAMIEGRDMTSAIENIKNGSLATIEVSQSGNLTFPCSETGSYSFVIVGYDSSDEAKTSASVGFKFTSSHDNTETWVSLGMAEYTEDFMASIWGTPVVTYDVEIQESVLNPGKFRLVNPYGEIFPFNEPGDWDDSRDYYVEINAMDPEGVYIELQNTGLHWDADGDFYVYSSAAYNMDLYGDTLEEVKEEGMCGTYSNGVITFPTNALLGSFQYDEGPYYANSNGGFKVVMPSYRSGAISQSTMNRSFAKMNRNPKQVKVNKVLKRYTFLNDQIW